MKKIELLPHQDQAIRFIEGTSGGAILSLPCGAGKTLISLFYMAKHNTSTLIVCPRSLVGSWQAENEKWGIFPEITPILGKNRSQIWDRITAGERGVFIISYETLLKDYRDCMTIRQIPWDLIVGDESSKIKNPTAKVSKMFLLLKSTRKILLNATVIENDIGDLWSQCEAIERGVLYGNFYKFRAVHAVMNQYFPGVKYWRDKEQVINKVKHIVFTISKEDINASLPPITEQVIPVEMKTKQARVYKEIKDELLLEIDGEKQVIGNVLTKLTRLRQTTNGLWAFGDEDESAKVEALEELLLQFGEEKSIIFTQFSETAEALRRLLCIRHAVTGDTTKRDEVIKDWRETGQALVGTSALMKGHNLQDARYVVFVDMPWTYAMYEQAFSRAWRTGQKKPVTVYILEAQGTVDEKIRKLVTSKKEDGDMLKRMTICDIKNLLC